MRLFSFFSLMRDELPVTVDEIADWILEAGHVTKISFHETESHEEEISGLLYYTRLKGPYASNNGDNEIAHIVTNTGLTEDKRRVIATKELLHICDSEAATARTKETVDAMIGELILPVDVQKEIALLRPETFADKVGILRAIAVLFPKEVRDEFKPHYDDEKITDEALSSLVDMPLHYVRFIMSDEWDNTYEHLLKLDAELSK